VVNVASRLQELAAPGHVVVGATTRLAVRGVQFEALGPVTVKGREEPVDAYRAIEAVALPGGRGGAYRAPLIGRDAELAMRRAALEHTIAHSRANFALLVGEAGIGKTRLAAELGDRAECSYDARVLVGHCLPYGESNVWWPIGSMLEEAAGITSNDD